jgi:hypothetical protein
MKKERKHQQKRSEFLEKKVQTKAELMAEHIAAKKVLGNFKRQLVVGLE